MCASDWPSCPGYSPAGVVCTPVHGLGKQLWPACVPGFDVTIQGLHHLVIRPLQKFSSASKYAALSVDGEDDNEGEDTE